MASQIAGLPVPSQQGEEFSEEHMYPTLNLLAVGIASPIAAEGTTSEDCTSVHHQNVKQLYQPLRVTPIKYGQHVASSATVR